MVVAETETNKPPKSRHGPRHPSLLELAKCLVVEHGTHVSFLNITTEASTAHTQLLHSPTLPLGLDIIDISPVDISALVNEDTLILIRICINVEENLKPLNSIPILIELGLGKPQALFIDLYCSQAFDIEREVEGEFVDLPGLVLVPGCTPVRPEDLLDQVRHQKIDEYKRALFHISRLPMAAGNFLNSWDDFEPTSLRGIREHPFYKQIPTPPVHPLGPLIKQHDKPELDDECLAWLDKQPLHSVLVALGSGGHLSAAQLTELAWGLELSQKRFILVARKPADACASASATFFNVGENVNDPKAYWPDGFLERTKEMGLAVPTCTSRDLTFFDFF